MGPVTSTCGVSPPQAAEPGRGRLSDIADSGHNSLWGVSAEVKGNII